MTRPKLANGIRLTVPPEVRARQTKSLSLQVNADSGKPCAGDPEKFFPIGQTAPAKLQTAEAKGLCNSRCRVQAQCLELTLRNEVADPTSADGVFGGFSRRERAFEVRVRRDAAAKAAREAAEKAAREAAVVTDVNAVDDSDAGEVAA